MTALSGAASSLKLVRESRWQMVTKDTVVVQDDSSRPLSPTIQTDSDDDGSRTSSPSIQTDSDDDGSRPSSPANQTSSPTIALKTPEGITLTLHKGEIASQQVDVIVNSTVTSLQLNLAALSRSILDAGGTTLQDECERNAPDGIEYGDVVVTSGGQLMCQYVIHGAACSWADGQCKQVLGKFVANSLMEAHKKNLASIAIPALGTGGHGIPPEVSAEVMFDELCEFCRLHPHTKLRDVRFVVYPKDVRTVQAFEKVLLNRCFAMTVETAEGMKLSLCVSDLADEQADVIVNSAGTELQLHRGQASKALLERGGKTLQEQCDSNAPSGIKFGEVVVTSGGQLQSPYVVHGACCGWKNGPETCKQILGQLITNSFKVVHEKTLTSIAFPAIGTGVLQIPPRFVAKVMIDELLKFSHQNPKTTLEDVRFITYFTNFPAMQAFSKVLRSSCSVLPDPPPAQKDYFPLPTFWRVMDSTQYCKLDELHTASSEFQIVENLFKPKEECEIKKIERVQNPKLYRQFMVHKKDMEGHSDDSGTVERRLWHGTTKTGAGGINTYGFNRSYCGANGTLYGNGVYFAVESSYSSSDTYSAPDGNGLKRMFLARVLTGVYTKGKRGLRVPPLQPGKDGVLFDTVVNSVSRPTIFVVFNDCQAYPEYLVTFK